MKRRLSGVIMVGTGMAMVLASAVFGAEPEPAPARQILQSLAATLAVMESNGIPLQAGPCSRAIIQRLVKEVDPLARHMPAEEIAAFREERAGVVYEPGLRIGWSNDAACVTEVTAGSPAAAVQKLRPGARVFAVGDYPCTGNPFPWRMQEMLRGTSTGVVTLAWSPDEGPAQTTLLARVRATAAGIEESDELPLGMGYVRVSGLHAGSGPTLARLLRRWSGDGRSGVILDLRGAGGTDEVSVIEVASLLARGDKPLFSIGTLGGVELRAVAARPGKPLVLPLMVLVDGQTRGAAELLAAVLEGSVRGAILLGTPTQGDPLVRELLDLPAGGALYMATRRVMMADGRAYDGQNWVDPHITVLQEDAKTAAEPEEPVAVARRGAPTPEERDRQLLRQWVRGDPMLRRAVDLLLGLKALNIRGEPHAEGAPR